MNKITIGVASREEVSARFIQSIEIGQPHGTRINFETEEQFWKTLTRKHWEILKKLTGARPMTMREVARCVGCDVKAVHGDVKTLFNTSLLDKTEGGKIVFPYDSVHVDFVMKAA